MKKTLLILVVWYGGSAWSLSTPPAFTSAVEAYDAGRYPEAIEKFSSLLKAGEENATLRFNLGDAYFRNKELGDAIFQFRKAYELSPRDPDLKYNLGYARAKVVDRIEGKEFASRVAELPWNEREAWYFLAVVSIGFWAIQVILHFVSRPVLRAARLVAAGAMVLGVLGAGAKWVGHRPFGVITQSEAEVFSGVGRDNVLLFKLHEGVEFWRGPSEGDWIQISLSDGKKGWILKKDAVF